MDQRIKNALGAVGVVAIILVALASWTVAGSIARSATAGATFSVSGQGKAVGVPDVAQFTFSIVTEGGLDIASLQEDNTEKADAAVAFVKSQGVEAKDIETQGYNIQPRYQSFSCRSGPIPFGSEVQPCPPSEIVGYTVSQTIQVKVRDFSKTGAILAGVTERGANSVSGLDFTVDNPSQLQNEARSKAIQDAQEQAEAMADAGDFRLGRLISVNEGASYSPVYRLQAEDSIGSAALPSAMPAPSIGPGSEQVSAQVTLTYEIR